MAGWLTFDDFREYDFHGPDPVGAPVWIAAVLRTWEDRFGARLLNVGPGAEIRLLVQRPPATRQAAQRVAAEHYAFADECDPAPEIFIGQALQRSLCGSRGLTGQRL